MEEQPTETPAPTSHNDEKMKVFRFLLSRHASVFIHFRPLLSNVEVKVPFRLRGNEQVVFQLGVDMPVPIPDLAYDARGVSGTLSFKGNPFHCHVPWEAVIAMVGEDGKGLVWVEDMSAKMRAELTAKSEPPQAYVHPEWPEPKPVSETAKTGTYLKPVNKAAAAAGWGVITGDKK
jgi:stringent starvation protein B